MDGGPGAPSKRPAPGEPRGFDLLEHLETFLAHPGPKILLILGAPGTGKSTLLQTLIPRLRGPRAFVAYRAELQSFPGNASNNLNNVPISLLFVDPAPGEPPRGVDPSGTTSQSMSFAPAAVRSDESYPEALRETTARMVAAGGGTIVVDSWDPESAGVFQNFATSADRVRVLTTTAGALRGEFGRQPVTLIVALPEESDPGMVSISDGVLELGWEEAGGYRLRVVKIPKLRRVPVPETRYLYSLEGGKFQCPPQLPPGYQPPIGPPDADPAPDDATLFPGSIAFADAFGRLHPHSFTGVELPPGYPSRIEEVFAVPLIAHALRVGGRVVWLPPPTSGPNHCVAQTGRFVPVEAIHDRLRVLAVGEGDSSLGDLRRVVLAARREGGEGGDLRSAIAPPVAPLFPEALHFLRGTPEGRPALFVISLDGIQALASASGITLTPATYPMVIGTYARLPAFFGFGFGRADDPLSRVVTASLDTHLRVEEKYGRTVLFGIRPRTNPYLIDCSEPSGRYRLLPLR